MNWIVIDASVILRALDEQHSIIEQKFIELIKDVENEKTQLFAPPLLWIEAANGLRFSNKTSKKAQELLFKITALPIRLIEMVPDNVSAALKLSYKLGTTTYDSWYHITALWLGATFITADKKYYNKAKDIGNIECWG